ncbi:DUF4383 domain-containing protein [Streptomyces sp. NBC_01142]|uniref:hypothetical protein n=1 Tax=Streptomyces sp. NBC_01142 TaxID=2975865 RepID=UPI00224DB6DA|nr:hypothetical protein [Streptomyces sp. NBC_01142]MCX4819552.1 DUF4383 domain-containing protein [Streptomyces sp. NBC_01142]
MKTSETKKTTDVTDKADLPDKATEPADPVEPSGSAVSAEPAESTDSTDSTESAAPAEPAASEADGHGAGETTTARDVEAPRGAASGLGAAAAGVVAAGLGVVALSGSWVGKIAAERQTLIGQIETSQGGTPAQQIAAIYGDAWHTTAMVNGIFALVALVVGLAVLAWPQKAGWVRAFAVAGVVLGVLGLIVSAGMYFDFLLEVPSTGATPGAGTGS